ncbi:MAG: 50S ribosomal protein L18 [Pseudomonadota bacterium]|nr:50S ribosomal protein L18 [Pseudomonadota bacterium]
MAYSKAGDSRVRRKKRIRKKVFGGTERPRLTVYRTSSHMYAQIVDDVTGATLVAASTLSSELKGHEGHRGNIDAAKAVGKLIAERARAASIEKVVFDRNGFLYHGRVQALADSAREAGLDF